MAYKDSARFAPAGLRSQAEVEQGLQTMLILLHEEFHNVDGAQQIAMALTASALAWVLKAPAGEHLDTLLRQCKAVDDARPPSEPN